MTRRQAIGRVAAIGAAVWVAPAIATTDAVAAQSITGTFRYQWNGSLTPVTPTNGGSCDANTYNNLPQYPGLGLSAALVGTNYVFTLTSNCRFTNGVGRTTGSSCVTATISVNGKTATIAGGGQSFEYLRVRIVCP